MIHKQIILSNCSNSASRFQGNFTAKKNMLDPAFQCLLLGSLPIYNSLRVNNTPDLNVLFCCYSLNFLTLVLSKPTRPSLLDVDLSVNSFAICYLTAVTGHLYQQGCVCLSSHWKEVKEGEDPTALHSHWGVLCLCLSHCFLSSHHLFLHSCSTLSHPPNIIPSLIHSDILLSLSLCQCLHDATTCLGPP